MWTCFIKMGLYAEKAERSHPEMGSVPRQRPRQEAERVSAVWGKES